MITPPQLWWSATLAAQDPHDPPHVHRHPLAGVLHHDGLGWFGWVDGGLRTFADGVPDDAGLMSVSARSDPARVLLAKILEVIVRRQGCHPEAVMAEIEALLPPPSRRL